MFTGLDLDEFERTTGPFLPHCSEMGILERCGQLSCTIEGGGKRRIFAIGNFINQRLLAPIQKWLMKVLRRIPMDGTFNQTKPLDLLKGATTCSSFDLKSATEIGGHSCFFLVTWKAKALRAESKPGDWKPQLHHC